MRTLGVHGEVIALIVLEEEELKEMNIKGKLGVALLLQDKTVYVPVKEEGGELLAGTLVHIEVGTGEFGVVQPESMLLDPRFETPEEMRKRIEERRD